MEVNSNLWLGPELIVRPGSPIVFVKHWRLVARGSVTQGWGGPKNTVTMTVPDATYARLDIRTCVETPPRSFVGRPTEFSWGAPPDDLWVYAPDSGGAVEPVGGGLRIDVSVDLQASTKPDAPLDADVGIGWRRATGLHIWDLGRRAVADVPLPPGTNVVTVVAPQRGDRTLLAVARGENPSGSNWPLDVFAVASPDPRAPAPAAHSVRVPLARRAGVSDTRSVGGGTQLALVSGGPNTRDGSELIVVDTTGGAAGSRVNLDHDPWALTRRGPARLVRATSPTPSPARGASCRSLAAIMDLESGGSRAIELPTCASTIEMVDDAPYAIIHLATAYQGTGRLLLDLERATLTSLPDSGGTPHVMGGTVYFASPTRVLAMDLAAPTRMRVAVTGLENLRAVWVEPSSRRLVLLDLNSVLVFDAGNGRITRCL